MNYSIQARSRLRRICASMHTYTDNQIICISGHTYTAYQIALIQARSRLRCNCASVAHIDELCGYRRTRALGAHAPLYMQSLEIMQVGLAQSEF